jgi:hypothetical protein
VFPIPYDPKQSDEGLIVPPDTKLHMDDLLDDALKQTFPASDAVAVVVPRRRSKDRAMANTFKVGDRVTWNSEAGRVSGTIVKIHTTNVNYKGYVHHASKDAPQYEIKSDKTDHVALHKGTALKRTRR